MITDEQIRELARGVLTAGQHKDCAVLLAPLAPRFFLTGRALVLRVPTKRERLAARARLTEILHARKEQK